MQIKHNIFVIIISTFVLLAGFSMQEIYGKKGSNNMVKIYQFTWNGYNISGSLYVNEFLMASFAGSQETGTAPLNVWLIGDNEIRAEVKKTNKSEESYFSFGVSELQSGDAASTSDRGKLVSIEKKDRDFAGLEVNKIIKKFKSSINFNGRFSGTGKANEKEVIEYAKKIYNIIKNKDRAGLGREFAVKIEDYSKAFSNDNVYDQVKDSLAESLFSTGRLEKINPDKLIAKKTGPKGNTWHVFEGNNELIRHKSPDGSSEMAIYIGVVNGELKVIR